MGSHDSADDRRRSRARTILIVAASITWMFAIICLIGLCATGDPDARAGFVILGVPFLAAAAGSTYGARAFGPHGIGSAKQIRRAARGGRAKAPVTSAPDKIDLRGLPADTSATLTGMRRGYAELDAKLADDERDTEAWRTLTQIMHSIVPTTVQTYRRVAGKAAADAEFGRAVQLLAQTFQERRTVVEGLMLDDLWTETRYIEDRFKPSELTTDD